MDKPLRFISPSGQEMTKEEVTNMFSVMSNAFLHRPKRIQIKSEPPKDIREFEDRWGKYDEALRNLLFGFTYDIESGKTLKREKTPEVMVDALCRYEKNTMNLKIINEQLQPWFLIAFIIEKDAPLVICDDIYLFGIERDRSGLSIPQKNKIAVQAVSQSIWHLKKNKIPTIEKMKEMLLDKHEPFFDLLQLDRFNSESTLEDWISEVFPLPLDERKGRTPKAGISAEHFENLIPIPGVFTEDNQVNLLKLRFVIKCLAMSLNLLGLDKHVIEDSPLIKLYQSSKNLIIDLMIFEGIRDAYSVNGSIFGPKFDIKQR
jgi:hypothetical protein